ncbi:hypothetical protein BCR44DRAFT_127544 [Catenaria anguillulae PL171]|uniref:P-loop containing nucleoside triphosphate hydrolase protein n=1 Tax=Catenaria anguillulae PL171 TaxID=765915 RepID=A0A1Y2HCI1_9FUNG|nr:hypothetical protein BCR44DRAFT_127544 [Catenaria anguillulae PL171]
MISAKQSIKIVIGGPAGAGKSVVANFLASMDRPDMLRNYTPTPSVRILEFTRDLSSTAKNSPIPPSMRGREVAIELWDLSGDERFQFWPTAVNDLHGLLLVMNADDKDHERALEQWANLFPNLKESQLLVYAQKHENPAQSRTRPKLGKPLSRVPLFFTSQEADGDLMRREFDGFLVNCMRAMVEQQGKDESAVLQSAVQQSAMQQSQQQVQQGAVPS